MTTTSKLPRITKVLSATDTREWVEGPDDRWHPIGGSGDARECDRCGRAHEVHVTVELEDGTSAVVGTSCAKAESIDVPRAITTAAGRATRRAKALAEFTHYSAVWERAETIARQVWALDFPPIVVTPDPSEHAPRRIEITCGDARCWSHYDGLSPERRECVVGSWRARRLDERCEAELGLTHAVANSRWIGAKAGWARLDPLR